MRTLSRNRPGPALIVAIIALVMAMAGSAIALPGKNTVGPGDIKEGAVRSKQIKDGKVKPWDINKRARFFAKVRANGDLVGSSLEGVGAQHTGPGEFVVDTNSFKVEPCAAVAQVTDFDPEGPISHGEASTKPGEADDHLVVGTFDSAGDPANRGFTLFIACQRY